MNDDTRARQRILTEFGTTLFVEAAAGTGKTTALVGRIVSLVRQGAGNLDSLVAMTFTEPAAGEMKLRLRSEIELARGNATHEERARLDHALAQLELARLDTIHAFCGDLLRERPVEAGIDPLFTVSAEDEAEKLADQTFDRWFEEALANPSEGVRRVLRRWFSYDRPREALRGAFARLIEHRDFPGSWRRDPFDRDTQIDRIMLQLAELGELASTSSSVEDRLATNLTEVQRFVVETARGETIRGRDHDLLEAELRELDRHWSWQRKGHPKTRFGTLSRDEVLGRRDQAKQDLDDFIAASDADLAALLHQDLRLAVVRYEEIKEKSGSLDFLDLLIRARDLIRDNASVRADLQNRFSHLFVDEFQDTDPLQAEIVLLLAADDPEETDWHKVHPVPGKLFLVGDPKQSIYRFRRADIAIYEDVKKRLIAGGAELLHLTRSFRAPPSIQRLVNLAFEPIMKAASDGSQADYVALEEARPETTGRPTIVALPIPRPYDDKGKVTGRQIELSYPDAVGAFVGWVLKESNWTVDENREQVPVQARHVCVLFRRFRNYGADVTRPYVRALEARSIPHLLVGGRSFHDREEVIALRNALTAIEWPDDELKVYATLRGPFFAIGDAALLLFRQHIDSSGELHSRQLHPMYKVDRDQVDADAHDVIDALALLRTLHIGRNHRPIAQTIMMLLEAVRAHAGIALWPNGEQALANCMRLVDMARRFERNASSFRAFVEQLEAQAERSGTDEAPIVEEGTDGVRMMTIHKAKGLEFPIVILAEPASSGTPRTPSRHVDPARRLWLEPICGCSPIELKEAAVEELRRDAAEAIRLTYVALTRARDLLVIPASGDAPIDGWLSVLGPVLYPPEDERRSPGKSPGCPIFGSDSVLDRGPNRDPPSAGSVQPGLHRAAPDGPPIVWWDPAILKLDVEERAPLRQQHILEADPEGIVAAAGEESYARWRSDREDLISRAAQPLLSSQRVTTLARTRSPDETVQVERVERTSSRPAGRRFGALVHLVLAEVDLNAGREALREAVRLSARLVDATDDEEEAAFEAVATALNHRLMRQAAGAADLRRESPIFLRLPDGTLAEGVVDLAFRSVGPDFEGWTVVDFKTDREIDNSEGQYAAQVGLYADAIAHATNSPTRAVLLVL